MKDGPKMKKTLLSLTLIVALLGALIIPCGAEAPEITAQAAIVMELSDGGEVMYEKAADARMYPASLTKLMTALMVFEHIGNEDVFDKEITATLYAVTHPNLSGNGSTAGILPQEKLTLWDLLNFLMIPSANDAANVLAEYVAGSVESFVALMNSRARELGLTGTNFVNPHGEHDENHYTTARDVARIMAELSKYDKFLEIASTRQYIKEPTNKYKSKRIFNNTCKMVNPTSSYYSEYVRAGKTGTTTPAGSCLCTYAERDGMKLVCVTLHSTRAEDGSSNNFPDQKALYKWVYKTFVSTELAAAQVPVCEIPVRLSEKADRVALVTSAGFSDVVNIETFDPEKVEIVPSDEVLSLTLDAPVLRAQKVGTATVRYDGQDRGTVELETVAFVDRSGWLYFKDRVGAFFRLTVVRVLIVLAVIAFIVWMILREIRVRRRARAARLRRYR